MAQNINITDLTVASLSEKIFAIEYDVNNNPIFIGEAKPGSEKSSDSWRIKKLLWDAQENLSDIKWAEGSQKFEFIWDQRATYNYF